MSKIEKRMKHGIVIFLLFVFIMPVSAQQKVPIITEKELQEYLHNKNDTTYIVNFWATWCLPCLREMPLLLNLAKENKDRDVSLLLVSLDFSTQIENKLIPYVEKKNIKEKVVVLDTPPGYAWIDAVDSSWNGGIPATVIYNSQRRIFHHSEFESKQELDSLFRTVYK